MDAALGSPTPEALVSAWRWQPVCVAFVVLAALGYALALRRLPPRPRWPWGRTVTFGVGLALFVWATCGFLGVYANALFWAWTTQLLVLLLVVPTVLMAGQPVALSGLRAAGPGLLARLARSRFGRVIANPLISPAIVPLVVVLAVFGPLPAWTAASPPFDTVFELLVLLLGAAVALPVVTIDVDRSSQAVGLTLTVGLLELALVTMPGIALRVATEPGQFFDQRSVFSWSPDPLADQRLAGAVLWCVAAVLGLPFFAAVFWRWLRADAREAAETDVVLDAEHIAHGEDPDSTMPVADPPWWLSDAELRRRFGGPQVPPTG